MTDGDIAVICWLVIGVVAAYDHGVTGWRRYLAWSVLWFPAVVIEAIEGGLGDG